MQVKATKVATLMLGTIAKNNMGEDSKIAIGEFVNSAGQTCQLQLVATTVAENHTPIDPKLLCVVDAPMHR